MDQLILVKNNSNIISLHKDLIMPISLEELEKTLKSTSNCSSPGPDGITYSFYKLFKKETSPHLLEIFNNCYKNFTPISGSNISYIRLIYK